MSKPKVPNTITDKQMADLNRRSQKGPAGDWFSAETIKRRKAFEAQQKKAGQS
jgi:hypothetical protein